MGSCLGKAGGSPHEPSPGVTGDVLAKLVPRGGRKLRTNVCVADVYRVGRCLGEGAFSEVRLLTDRDTGKQYACKIMRIPELHQKQGDDMISVASMRVEISLMLDVEHPNIVNLKEYFIESGKLYMVMDLCGGASLMDAFPCRGQYSEAQARLIFGQLMSAVHHLHSMHVVHRDLKLENLLLVRRKELSSLKLADFGLARRLPPGSTLTTICGTPRYIAPEVLKGRQYGLPCDLWSAGVILFILLAGHPPFHHDDELAMFKDIMRGKYSMDDLVWKGISKEAKSLVQDLLQVDPAKRLSAEQVLLHPWLVAGNRLERGTGAAAAQQLAHDHTQGGDRPSLLKRMSTAAHAAAAAVTTNEVKLVAAAHPTANQSSLNHGPVGFGWLS